MSLVDARITELKTALALLTTPRPLSQYHEDMGPVLWWKFPIVEEPYVGGPNDCGFTVEACVTMMTQVNQDQEPVIARINAGGWPGYHTHWTPLPKVVTP